MVRGLYTGASAMAARLTQMDVVANNLANVSTTGFKEDLTLFKAFPEMLMRRQDDDGVHNFPLGSWDSKPVVGRLGTGVEVNEVHTKFEQGNLVGTENPFDFALSGSGFFTLKTPEGERYTRNGSFTVDPHGILVSKEGWPVLGENGIIRVKANNFTIKENGEIFVNEKLQDPLERQVRENENSWEQTGRLDKLKLVQFPFPFERYIKKEGTSLYRDTELSGKPVAIDEGVTTLKQGYLESSNINVVREMVHMIEVQRSYEASQKSVSTHDGMLERLINSAASVA